MPSHTELANLIWSVADLLRGDYRPSEYGRVILPFTVLRRMDCVMEPTREQVRARDESLQIANKDALLRTAAKLRFYNVSEQSFRTIGNDASQVVTNLHDYLNGFSPNAREIIDKYDFHRQVDRLHSAGILYKVVQRFADVDLSLAAVSTQQMGYVFEELIRRFSEFNTAGEHFTPPEVVELMVNLLIAQDTDRLTGEGEVINVLDPACGTGGMLSAADNLIRRLNPEATVFLFGQELNAESYAICRSDMMMTDHEEENIVLGNSFSDDGHDGRTFDYMLANPPFGVEWKKVLEKVVDEHEAKGHAGRFGAGLPRINDGSFLFLQHMLSKVNHEKGSRVAIVFNGSPLFSGAAGSGESEIRRWILENDLLEAVVALPDQLFYNTGISTYFWILTNRKARKHQGKVVLLDAREYWTRMRKSLGEKRKQITEEQIDEITRLYADALRVAAEPEHPLHSKVKVFDNRDFGYQRIAVDRPLRQRFEISDETLTVLAEAKPLMKFKQRDALLDVLKSLHGTVWSTKTAAKEELTTAVAAAGVLWPVPATEKAIWAAIGISDPDGEVQTDRKGNPLPDPDLRDYENLPLVEDIDDYFDREVRPHVPDAWIAEIKDAKTGTTSRARIGYEIPFTRQFYVYTPPRPLGAIDGELRELEAEIQKLLSEVTG